MPWFDRQGLLCPAFGCRVAWHGGDGPHTPSIATLATRTPVVPHSVDAHRQSYVPQFAPADRRAQQTPYRHRLTSGLVQQGLSVAGDVRDSNQFGCATDKRYSLGHMASDLHMRPSVPSQKRVKSQADPDKRADSLIKLADYHRKAMEARRAAGFRAFLLLSAFYVAVLFQVDAFLKSFAHRVSASVLVSTFVLVAFLAFAHTMREHAKRNEGDRRRYVCAEAEAWCLLSKSRWEHFYADFVDREPSFIPVRSAAEQLRANWASSEVFILGFLLLVACLARVWNLA